MTRDVPLFPLGSVLFPGLVLPLNVFEPRYRALVRDLQRLPPEQRLFGVVAIRSGHEVGEDGVRALHGAGCLARLQAVSEQPDGRYEITSVGTTRFRLLDVRRPQGAAGTGPGTAAEGPRTARRRRERGEAGGPPYLVGTVEELAEADGEAADVVAPAVATAFARYRDALGVSPVDTTAIDARLLSYIVASAVLLDQVDRQSLLEAPDTTERLRLELKLLRREAVLLRELGAVPGSDAARMTPGLN